MIRDKYKELFLTAPLEEVLDVAIAEDLDLKLLEVWALLKIAQNLQKIVDESVVTHQDGGQ